MAKHRGESSKMGEAEPLPQAAVGGLQVQTCSQTVGATHEEHGSKQDEREVGYSPRVKEAQLGALAEKRSHKGRLTIAKTRRAVRNGRSAMTRAHAGVVGHNQAPYRGANHSQAPIGAVGYG
ncbi:hypothetical protein B296_00041963 [Ensete ventricosum]|uniref:Uncharacterized protein n=1 Tax=Ensete ventricosum TaxID=4639 RepID=A0A426Z6E2_ENSVE|nr:hypothetical protein B296_00041963 [Ensete ventricosum]